MRTVADKNFAVKRAQKLNQTLSDVAKAKKTDRFATEFTSAIDFPRVLF